MSCEPLVCISADGMDVVPALRRVIQFPCPFSRLVTEPCNLILLLNVRVGITEVLAELL
ncbi:hypothetical protein D3C85_1330410 [compost metagenome]